MDAQTVIEALAACGLDVRKCRVRAFKSYRYRPVLCCSITCFDHGRGALVRKVVIGKAHVGGAGAEAFEVLKELWQSGFDDRRLAVPEPIAFVPAQGILLQERAAGRDLHRDIASPARSMEKARLAARWLAKLHAAHLTRAPPLPLPSEEEKVSRYAETLSPLFPAFARRIKRLARRVIASLGAASALRRVPTHGDFQPKNIHVSGDRITVFDFDQLALAPPARDLGHFIGQCSTMSHARTGSFHEIEAWNDAFLDEYTRRASREAVSAVPTFVARTFLEVLYYRLFVFPAGDSSFVPSWLEECERWEASIER